MNRLDMVTVANEQVPIATVCRMLGVDVTDDELLARSRKVRCPFGDLYHSDQGHTPAMRVYPDTNSAYCFSCATYYLPVDMAARGLHMSRRSAALVLLDRIGYRGLDLAEVFADAQQYRPVLDRAQLADALKTYCRRIDPQWSKRQFDSVVAPVLTRCLGLLDLVESDHDVALWLDTCKLVMSRTLQPPNTVQDNRN